MSERASVLDPAKLRILDRLACPQCHVSVAETERGLSCGQCGTAYPIVGSVFDFRPPDVKDIGEFRDWTKHWAQGNQQLFSQRFFSLYRKQVFARTVAWFIDRFFPREGVFVEAGSGTAETSMRIDTRGGSRVLIAADIILPILERCPPVMSVKVGADIFRLPFRDGGMDGLWNVGVMEHFTHDRIDAMMREFHRVLAPGAPVLLLWPATDSLPQRALRLVERFINRRATGEPFKFHPDEISKLRSGDEGREVLARNGFEPVFVDEGLRSLMAFKTIVGRKRVSSATPFA